MISLGIANVDRYLWHRRTRKLRCNQCGVSVQSIDGRDAFCQCPPNARLCIFGNMYTETVVLGHMDYTVEER